jgi:hypothetical protein
MGEFIERLVPRRAGRDLTLDVFPALGRATRCCYFTAAAGVGATAVKYILMLQNSAA